MHPQKDEHSYIIGQVKTKQNKNIKFNPSGVV
jgi:hypothetical protein